MTLSGSERAGVRPRGGVAGVSLVPAGSFAGAVGNSSGDGFVSFEASEDTVEYVFREDRAHYSETLSGEDLQPLVRHTLVMEFPAGRAACRATTELVERSGEGFVAIVTMASGERVVAGWSVRFGAGYPLRVAKVLRDQGSVPADFPVITLTLESVDADFSKGLI